MFLDTRLGNTTPRYFNCERSARMLVPPDILQCAVFLGTPLANDPQDIECRCTGFLVGVPTSGAVPGSFVYLVTARHYVDNVTGKTNGVRMNMRDGGARVYWLANGGEWWYHPTEPDTVDVAVSPIILPEGHDHRTLPIAAFATKEAIQGAMIGPGDEVFLPGLFVRQRGRTRNTPIVRIGNVAGMPDDSVPISLGGRVVDADAYLIEVRSMGGLSGSPIFVQESVAMVMRRETEWKKGEKMTAMMRGQFYLLGLMHGHWNIRPGEHNRPDWRATAAVDESIALGISVAVPAKKILEVLNQPGLVESRERAERLHLEKHGATSTTSI